MKSGHLIPILSFVLLRSKSACCGQRIDSFHLLSEVGCAAIGAISLGLFGISGVWAALLGWILFLLALLDARHFWLPDRLTLPLLLLGLASPPFATPDLASRLIGAVAGYAVLSAIAFFYLNVRKRVGLGGGDAKLLGAIGAWTGWVPLPFILLCASSFGLLWIVILRLGRRQVTLDTRLPLGTFLSVAAWPIWVAEQFIVAANR